MQEAAQGASPMTKIMMMGLGGLSKAFYNRYGDDALPIITEVMSQGGAETGKLMKEMAPVKDMQGFSETFKMMAAMLGADIETVELSDDKFRFKAFRCPLGIDGTSKGLCEAIMTHDAKMASALLGQEMELNVIKAIAAGDKECDVVFTIK